MRDPREVVVTRRAYWSQLWRVIRWQGRASSRYPALCAKGSQNENFHQFQALFGKVCEICTFINDIDHTYRNYNEKSTILAWSRGQAKHSDVALRVARLIFWWFFSHPDSSLIKSSFWVKIQSQADLVASPGRNFRRGTEIHNETIIKPSKI